jgi:hypothetical protein
MDRPDTPLAETPKPKPITIGRLKQVVDSLKKERSFNQKMLPPDDGYNESNTTSSSIGRKKYNDRKYETKFYQDRINKQTKSIDKYEAIIKNRK